MYRVESMGRMDSLGTSQPVSLKLGMCCLQHLVLRKTASKSPVSGQVNQCVCMGTKYCQVLHLSWLPSFGGKNKHSKKLSRGFLNWVSECFYVPFARKSSIFPVESLSLIRSPHGGGDPICYVSNEQAKQKGKHQRWKPSWKPVRNALKAHIQTHALAVSWKQWKSLLSWTPPPPSSLCSLIPIQKPVF